MQETIRILQDGDRVCILVNGRLVTARSIPWDHAKQIASRIMQVALLAEEWSKADQVATDAAILQRAGATIGITSNPRILSEAGVRVAHDRDIRRYMPSIKSQTQFGRPTLSGEKRNGESKEN